MITKLLVVGLFIGVVFLGARIYLKTGEYDSQMAEGKKQVKEKVAELKEEVAEKKAAIEKAYNEVKERLQQGEVKNAETPAPVAKVQSPFPANEKEKVPTPRSLMPLDEEDKKLTEEILGGTSPHRGEQRGANKKRDAPIPPTEIESNVVVNTQASNEFDIKRLAEIRDLYSKALEQLEWN